MAPTQSRVLDNDPLIRQVAASIDATVYYGRLGRSLLGDQAKVANILGKPIPHFEEAMYQCMIEFRNANGRGWEDSLKTIFEELQLLDALALLKKGRPEGVGEDLFIQHLTDKIPCLDYYMELGTRLLNNSSRVACIIGPITPSYTEALIQCIITWRNANGATEDQYTKFRGILMSHGLVDQAEDMDALNSGGQDDEVDLPSVPTQHNETPFREPEASLAFDTNSMELSATQ